MKNLNLLFSLLFTFLFFSTQAQFECSKWAVGIDFNIKSPTGELRNNGLTNLYGGNVEIFYHGLQIKNLIIAPGLRFSAGSTKFKEGQTYDLGLPLAGTATEMLSNEHGNFTGVLRFIYTKYGRFLPYGELYAGTRGFRGHERVRFDQEDLDDIDITNNTLYQSSSHLGGAALGILYKLNERGLYLNLKVSNEWTKEVSHLDIANSNNYSLTPTTTKSTSNLGFNIGFMVELFPCSKKNKKVTAPQI